ncbi:MAG TPA: hypothetical protein VG738_18625 [Chitinophagaceae bacterium]|nr:hypothetical protein [Chitinophagaceae bacterium]
MQNTPANSQVCQEPRRSSKRHRRAKRPSDKHTCLHGANGFLKKSFSPVIGQNLAILGGSKEIEKEYFISLAHFTALHDITMPSVEGSYPMNIARSFSVVKDEFAKKDTGLGILILKDENRKACIATFKTCDTGMNLFYIAVKPLARLLQNPRKKRQAQLLLSVFAYLYQVAGMPDYHNGYVGSNYEAIYENYEYYCRDIDESDSRTFISWNMNMQYFGRKTFKSIRHPYHLQQFENRLKRFIPLNNADKDLLKVSRLLFDLYKNYPSRRIFDNVHYRFLEPDEERHILPDDYISFFWDSDSFVYEELMEYINGDFQEIACTEEPIALQYFDTPQGAIKHDLAFEDAFFECLHHLADLLEII